MNKRRACLFYLCLLGQLVWGLGHAEASEKRIHAFVSIAPQKYFLQRIAGDRVQVEVMVPPGADPHTFEPKPSQMRALAQCDLYFAVGIESERVWLPKVKGLNPKMMVVHTEEGISRTALEHSRTHKGNEAHSKEAVDPHIWLAPALVQKQADRILAALVRMDPENEKTYRQNHQGFSRELDSLDREIKKLLAGREGESFLVLHPSWGYFARAYGLKQISIEIEGKEPKAADIQRIIRESRTRGIRVVFAQPQFSAKKAEMVAREINGKVVLLDPLAQDWAENLRRAAQAFKGAWGKY